MWKASLRLLRLTVGRRHQVRNVKKIICIKTQSRNISREEIHKYAPFVFLTNWIYRWQLRTMRLNIIDFLSCQEIEHCVLKPLKIMDRNVQRDYSRTQDRKSSMQIMFRWIKLSAVRFLKSWPSGNTAGFMETHNPPLEEIPYRQKLSELFNVFLNNNK